MNYRVFSTQDSDCSHILPPALCRMARTGEVLVFAGEEKEGELECVAAFSPSPHDRDEAVLQYLYVPQEKRNFGRAHGLLEFSRKELYRSAYDHGKGVHAEYNAWRISQT